jgi:hypothetical protein
VPVTARRRKRHASAIAKERRVDRLRRGRVGGLRSAAVPLCSGTVGRVHAGSRGGPGAPGVPARTSTAARPTTHTPQATSTTTARLRMFTIGCSCAMGYFSFTHQARRTLHNRSIRRNRDPRHIARSGQDQKRAECERLHNRSALPGNYQILHHARMTRLLPALRWANVADRRNTPLSAVPYGILCDAR